MYFLPPGLLPWFSPSSGPLWDFHGPHYLTPVSFTLFLYSLFIQFWSKHLHSRNLNLKLTSYLQLNSSRPVSHHLSIYRDSWSYLVILIYSGALNVYYHRLLINCLLFECSNYTYCIIITQLTFSHHSSLIWRPSLYFIFSPSSPLSHYLKYIVLDCSIKVITVTIKHKV